MRETDTIMADAPPQSHRIESIHEPGQNVESPIIKTYGPDKQPHIRMDMRDIYALRKDVQTLLGRRAIGFPGAQPVSFQRDHLDELRSQDYYVCEKSDGVRYLLWLTQDSVEEECQYLIDRKNQYWHINKNGLHFPPIEDAGKWHKDTVIDGELVLDDMGNGKVEPKFLVFDCLILNGMSLIERTLDKRLAYFKEKVFKPYRELFQAYPQELEFQVFLVEMKEMQFSYGLEMMFRQVLPSLRHGNDGLIFTCRNTPYCFGTDEHILKWKPANENTIDFKLALRFQQVVDPEEMEDPEAGPYLDYDSVPGAELFASRGSNQPYERIGELYISPDEWETLKSLGDPLTDRIIECGLDEQSRWRLYRFRDDKSDANHISTVKSVLKSIEHSVTEQELLEAAKSIKDNWKARQAQPPSRR